MDAAWFCPQCGRRYDEPPAGGNCADCPGIPVVDLGSGSAQAILEGLVATGMQLKRRRLEDRALLVGLAVGLLVATALLRAPWFNDPISFLIVLVYLATVSWTLVPLVADRSRPAAQRLYTNPRQRRRRLALLALLTATTIGWGVLGVVGGTGRSVRRLRIDLVHAGAPWGHAATDLAAAISRAADGLEPCLGGHFGLQGRYILRWQLGGTGHVAADSVQVDPALPAAVGACMRRVVRSWQLPLPQGVATAVRCPVLVVPSKKSSGAPGPRLYAPTQFREAPPPPR